MGDILRFEGKKIINPVLEIHYAAIGSFKEIAAIHRHDFFEIFMVTQGEVMHCVNGVKQHLTEGSLVFVRPDDAHYYERKDASECKLINVAFTVEVARNILGNFGGGLGMDYFTNPGVFPSIYIPASDREVIIYRIGRLNSIMHPDILQERFELNLLVSELILFFIRYNRRKTYSMLPVWMRKVCGSMENMQDLAAGTERIFQISGKTPEHVCRMFKKYLNMTPTEYVNRLKLNYAKNLLANSDESILDISFQAGFENLSHFYHCFKKQYGVTPGSFRNGGFFSY